MTWISTSQRSRLLYPALVDLHAEGHYAEQHRVVFLVADLVYTIPLQLDRVDRGYLAPEDILRWLHTRAHEPPGKPGRSCTSTSSCKDR